MVLPPKASASERDFKNEALRFLSEAATKPSDQKLDMVVEMLKVLIQRESSPRDIDETDHPDRRIAVIR